MKRLSNWKNYLSLILVLALLAGILAACGGSGGSSPQAGGDGTAAGSGGDGGSDVKSSGNLTLYTSLPESDLPPYFTTFEKQTGIKISYVRMSAGEMYARILAEKENPQAALAFNISAEIYMNGAEEDLWDSYQSPELSNIPDSVMITDPSVDGSAWNPYQMTLMVFAVNSDWFAENGIDYPRTWDDLLKPEFENQVSMPHPTTSGIAFNIVSTTMQRLGEEAGWEYLEALDKNIRQYTKAGAGAPMEVALGEAAVCITYVADGSKPRDEGYPVEIVVMDDQAGHESVGLSLIKNGPADQMENAKKFIDFILSVEGQECMDTLARMPVNVNAKVADGAITLDDATIVEFDVVWSAKNRTRLIEEFAAKIDNAESLKE